MPKWLWLLRQLTSRLWVRATLFCFIGIFTALLGLILKGYIPEGISSQVGADAVGNILQILASSMLAVTTFSLSIVVAAYAAASSSATPRATKLLLEDSSAQNALSTFIGSFLYSLVGIIALNMGIYGDSGRLVLFVVTLGVIFVIVAMLLQWIDHLSRLGRVGATIDLVENAARKSIKQRLGRPRLGGSLLESYTPSSDHQPVVHSDIGYIQHIDMGELSRLAEKHGVNFYLTMLPGGFSDSQKPLLYVSKALDEGDYDNIRNAYSLGGDRSFDQDPRYGLIVLGEIASRALSPAVNDPGTAIDVINTLYRLIAPWVSYKMPDDEISYPRLFVPAVTMADLFDDMFTAIARDGAGVVEIGLRLQKSFKSLYLLGDEECKTQAKRHSQLALKRSLMALNLQEDKDILTAHALA